MDAGELDFGEVLSVCDAALEALERDGEELGVARCRVVRAAVRLGLGRREDALADFDVALVALERHGEELEVARCRLGRAAGLQGLGRLEEALTDCDVALPVLERRGEELDAARCRVCRASALRMLGRGEDALTDCDVALEALERHGEELDAARCRVVRGGALGVLGRLEDALADCDVALEALERHGEELDAARCRVVRAAVGRWLGRKEQGLADCDAALEAFERHGEELGGAGCRAVRAGALWMLGRYKAALADCDVALPVLERHGGEFYCSRCRMVRAATLRVLGRGEEALADCDVTVEALERHGQILEAAGCRVDRAVTLHVVGRYEDAVADCDAALVLAPRAEASLAVRAQVVRAWSLVALERRDEAMPALRAGCDALEHAQACVGFHEESAAGLREQLPDPFLPLVMLLLEDAADASGAGHRGEAADLRARAFLLSERARSARFREELGRRFVAGLPLEGADLELLERWRALQRELALLDRRRGEADRRGALSAELEEQAERHAALLSELTALGRELFASDRESAAMLTGGLPGLEELRAAIGEDDGIVCYLTGHASEALVCLCLDREGVRAVEAVVGGTGALAPLLEKLAALVDAAEQSPGSQPPDGAAWRELLGELGAPLLALPAALGWTAAGGDAKRRLTFVPSGALFAVPFAALGLPDAAAYEPLVRRCEVGLAPQAFTRLYQTGKGAEAEGRGLVVLDPQGTLGLTGREKEALDGFLPAPEAEITDEPLTAEAALALMTGRPWTHLSCHARFEPGEPWASRLVFAGEGDDAASYVTALQLLGAPPGHQRLVFAAACEGGRAALLTGDEPLGLLRGLLARAAQVVAPHWQVANAATIDLEASFYAAWRKGGTAAGDVVAALALAQRAFLDGVQGDPNHHLRIRYAEPAHPYWWAAWQALG